MVVQREIIIRDRDNNILKVRKLNDKVIDSLTNGGYTYHVERSWIVFRSLANNAILMRVKLVNNWHRFEIVETPTTNC